MFTSHILIIDDDKGLLKALPEVLRLKMEGIVVVTSNSPRDALERVAHTDFDAIISDIKMPGMDGLTLLSEIRTLRPDTPILLMTSHDDRDLVLYALRGGAYDFIQKPIDWDYLLVSLERAIQTRELRRKVAGQKYILEQHAQELERAVQEAVAETQVAQRRLAFLAEATTLLASSLDYEATLSRLARLAVLYLADFCVVDVVDEVGKLRCVEVAHTDRRKEALVRRMRNYYQEKAYEIYPALPVLKTGRSLMYSDVTEAFLESTVADQEHLDILHELVPRSLMMVPLMASGKILGVLTFAVTEVGRRYGPEDLALAEDLTRRAALAVANARLYEEAQQALQIRDQFLSIAAHELKTPMTSILGTTQLLLRRLERNPNMEQRDLGTLRLLTNQTNRLNRLVDSLLNLSRLEAGQLTIDHEPVDLTTLIRRVTEEMRIALDSHKIEYNGPDIPLIVLGDELRLEQVLQNLLQNALKYSSPGGKIVVNLENAANIVSFSVSDEGPGIPQDAIPQLFNRFYRANNTGNRKVSGIGLGLYVVKEIVSLHAGTIEVQSEEGKGSVFSVKLPLHQPQLEQPKASLSFDGAKLDLPVQIKSAQ
jgi:signal transduction histidine kinase/FixJ family two-component response regulator